MKILGQIFIILFVAFGLIGCSRYELNPSYDLTLNTNVTIGDTELSQFDTRAPFDTLPNHFGKNFGLKQPTSRPPKKKLLRMGETEMKEWFKHPKIILSAGRHNSDPVKTEQWLFPDGSAIRFFGGAVTKGYYTIRNSTLCFSYQYKNSYCPSIYKDKNSIYFQLMSDPDFWAHATVQEFNSSITGHKVYNLITSGRGAEAVAAFSNSSNSLYATQSVRAPTWKTQQAEKTISHQKPVHRIKPNGQNDDIAIIIGNQRYNTRISNIPNVDPARSDVHEIYNYFRKVKNISKENILRIDNATQGDLVAAFGTHRNHKGTAFNWVKPGKSNLYVYYAGHGAPSEDGGMLVPTDARFDTIELNSYPVEQLLANLSKIPSKSTTVILESCFSGVSQAGSLVSNASPVYLKNGKSEIPSNINLITAAGPNQIASWQKDKRKSLFTKYLLEGLYGAADGDGYGNSDGKISQFELQAYLNDNLTYQARRSYGRDQQSQVQFTDGFAF